MDAQQNRLLLSIQAMPAMLDDLLSLANQKGK